MKIHIIEIGALVNNSQMNILLYYINYPSFSSLKVGFLSKTLKSCVTD
jgi:hypothetical protein